VKNTNKGG